MLALKIMAGLFLIAGFCVVLAAKNLVKKFKLEEKVEIKFEHEMNEEEMAQYKFMKATVNVKIYGMLVALPGIILTLVAFK